MADAEDPATALTVAPFPASGTNGVSLADISVNSAGNVSATVGASCTATTALIMLHVTDSGERFGSAGPFTVNVSANTPPTLGTYSTTTVALEALSTRVTPSAAPGDNGSVDVIGASASPNTFTGGLSVNLATGVVTVTNAAPAGSYTVTVTATDNCGRPTVRTFLLNVQAPSSIGSVSALSPPDKTKVKRGSTIPVKVQVLGTNGQPISAALAATFVCPRATGPTATVIFNNGPPVCAVYGAVQNFFQANIKTSSTLALSPPGYPLLVEVRQGGAVVASRQATVTITK